MLRQASLLSKLSLGSLVLSPRSLFPLWYEPLLESAWPPVTRMRSGGSGGGEVGHLLRVRPDLSDLPRALRWAAAHDAEASATAAAGQARACALLHTPHVAGYVARLLRRYAALFAVPHTADLHRTVRQLPHTPPFAAPERRWASRLGGINGRLDCSKWWLGGELRCGELRRLGKARQGVKRAGSVDGLPF